MKIDNKSIHFSMRRIVLVIPPSLPCTKHSHNSYAKLMWRIRKMCIANVFGRDFYDE